MKKINPLYLLGTVVFLMLFFMLASFLGQRELASVTRENMALKKEIDTIVELKKEYGDPRRKKRDFQRIADNSLIKPFVKTNTLTAAKATFSLEAADAKATKWFLEKLFNENFRVKSLEVTKGENGMDIKAEVLF